MPCMLLSAGHPTSSGPFRLATEQSSDSASDVAKIVVFTPWLLYTVFSFFEFMRTGRRYLTSGLALRHVATRRQMLAFLRMFLLWNTRSRRQWCLSPRVA